MKPIRSTDARAMASVRMRFSAPFRRIAGAKGNRLLIVADHASNALPETYGTLGLGEEAFLRHIASDIGIGPLTEQLAAALGAEAVLAGFSRLLIDPNRGEDDPTLIMKLSDGDIIPGNRMVDADERESRLDLYFRPYHAAIRAALDDIEAEGRRPILLSLHSFTPAWRGAARPWTCGVLWHKDAATAQFLLGELRHQGDLIVGDNEPYSGRLEGDCMDTHGAGRGIPHGLVEIRQDLIAEAAGQADWCRRLAPICEKLIKTF